MKRILLIIAMLWILITTSCRKEEIQKDLTESELYGLSVGLNENYVQVDSTNYKIKEYDPNTGTMAVVVNEKTRGIETGAVVFIDKDTAGYLRKITSITGENNDKTLQTVPATLEDVFIDKEFKLSTSDFPLSNARLAPLQGMSEARYNKNLSELLTDAEGYIHPVKVITHYSDGSVETYTNLGVEKENLKEDATYRLFNITAWTPPSNTIYQSNAITIEWETCRLSFFADAIMNFRFKGQETATANTKVSRGDLEYFDVSLKGTAQLNAKLKATSSKEISDEIVRDIKKSIVKKSMIFYVGAVPVYITYSMDLRAKFAYELKAGLEVTEGFNLSLSKEIGLQYRKVDNDITPINRNIASFTPYPLVVKGNADASIRGEIYPHIDMLFYGFFGPYLEIAPYLEGTFSARARGEYNLDGTAQNVFAWNTGVDIGIEARVGTKLEFLGILGKEYGPKVIADASRTLYQSPYKFTSLSFPSVLKVNQTGTISIFVADNLGFTAPLMPVYFRGEGNFGINNREWTLSNIAGRSSIIYTAPNTPGNKTITLSLKRADESTIRDTTFTIVVGDIERVLVVSPSSRSITKGSGATTFLSLQIYHGLSPPMKIGAAYLTHQEREMLM